jgi:hypothetical protein
MRLKMWVPLLIGGAAGLAKSHFIDKPKEQRQRKLAAETQRYSPWTGMQADKVQEADPFGSALQYGTTGAMMSAQHSQMESDKKLNEAMTNRLNTGGSALGYGKNLYTYPAPQKPNSYLGSNYDFGTPWG